ncbi:hypothetical protein AVEN_179262-1 [Araneus ventricosus]|uniref:Uncharacterized protein n=1 Tax=Araneus ventricosus TaxID=182803 RepID=A0A4Y2VGG8_ARAVE|nr:hypothetical protein AVEN_179262-1 [Araneus ventricosus]
MRALRSFMNRFEYDRLNESSAYSFTAPTRHPRELATSISAAVSNGTQGRRHVSCVVFDVDLKNKQFEIFVAADSTAIDWGRSGLVAGSRPRDQWVAGPKPDSIEDLPCMGPVAR